MGVPTHRSPSAPPASERMTLLDSPSAVVTWAKPRAGAAVQPRPVGADPQLALGALKDAAHQVAGEPVAGGVGGELLIPQQVEAAGVGAHPQVAFPILVERQDAVDG